MIRIFLILNAVLFIGFGAYVFSNTAQIFRDFGFGELGLGALYEVRSNYGGVSLGIGFLSAFAAFKSKLERPALFVLMTYTGGYALGRILALPYEGTPSATVLAYGVYEAVTASIAFLLLRRRSKTALA